MATRVRKLAKQLRCSPAEVLGMLKAIGYDRYRSPEDMLPDSAIARVKKGFKEGMRPLPVVVPGRAAPAPTPKRAAATPAPAPAPASSVPDPRDATIASLQSEVASLKKALEAARGELAAARADGEARRAAAAEGQTTLAEVLRQRGLRGADEQERALAALAERRTLRSLLDDLVAVDPVGLRQTLERSLVLVAGEPPPGLPAATVQVASDRAQVPDKAVVERTGRQLGEVLLLNGVTELVIVGGPSLLQRVLLPHLDPRVTLRFEDAAPDGATSVPWTTPTLEGLLAGVRAGLR